MVSSFSKLVEARREHFKALFKDIKDPNIGEFMRIIMLFPKLMYDDMNDALINNFINKKTKSNLTILQ